MSSSGITTAFREPGFTLTFATGLAGLEDAACDGSATGAGVLFPQPGLNKITTANNKHTPQTRNGDSMALIFVSPLDGNDATNPIDLSYKRQDPTRLQRTVRSISNTLKGRGGAGGCGRCSLTIQIFNKY